MASLFGDSPPLCPKCGIETAVPVFFATPSREMLVAEKLGQIALGDPGDGTEQQGWVCPARSCRSYF